MSVVDANRITVSFGDVTVLNGLNFSIQEGEVFGLLGPNGAGKTTTIHVLTGQLKPDSGEVIVNGISPIDKPRKVRQEIGILPEETSPPLLTANEYIYMAGQVRQLPEPKIEQQRTKWVDKFNITYEDTLTTHLSKGQKQLVMLVQAFFAEPDIVIIDEPLSNLDPILQQQVKETIMDYVSGGDKTVILSTHDMAVAADVCDRVGIMSAQTGGLERTTEVTDETTRKDLVTTFAGGSIDDRQ